MGTSESLQRWGWSSYFEALWNEGERECAVPARVIAQQRKFWRIAGAFGECWGEASGKLRLAAEEGVEWPTVGDWVVADVREAGSSALILEVLPRRSRFVRKMAGKRSQSKCSRRMWIRPCWWPRWMGTSIRGAWNGISRSAGSRARSR